MILENNNKETSETTHIFNVYSPQNIRKKNLFQIESNQSPIVPISPKKTSTITFDPNYKITFSKVPQIDFKPKFSIIPNNIGNLPLQNIPTFKFITQKEQNFGENLEQVQIKENTEEEKNNKNKEIKFKRKKFKKFKI